MGTTFRVEFEDELGDFTENPVDDIAQRIETLIGVVIGLPCFVEPEWAEYE